MNIKNLLITLLLSFNLFALAETYEVKMLNQGTEGYMVFEPAVLKINKGDTVTFKATDAAHNSASIKGMIPSGAEEWNGKLSQDISVTFNVEGVSQLTPLASMYAHIRTLRLADGPDEVHRRAVARLELGKYLV